MLRHAAHKLDVRIRKALRGCPAPAVQSSLHFSRGWFRPAERHHGTEKLPTVQPGGHCHRSHDLPECRSAADAEGADGLCLLR